MSQSLPEIGVLADRMGQKNGRSDFQQLAFYCLALTAAASIVQTVGTTWRDVIREQRRRDQGAERSR